MREFINLAKSYSKAGYSVIPVTSEKVPSIREWGVFQSRPMTEQECEKYFSNCWGIALLMGGKNMLTAIDFDLKYDLSGDLFERYKKALPKEILEKMYVQTTKNKGYHFIFSADVVEPNQKLASRYTTEYEKHTTYMEAFNDAKTRSKALKIASNDKVRVLLETRGGSTTISGGYVVMSPSPGYEFVYGKINQISIEEYNLILETARSFNDVIEERKDVRLEKYKEWKLNPFEDYNERGDVISCLLDSGWEECKGSRGKSIRLKRAGNPKSGSSALFDTDTRVFNCFSTSTSFDVGRGYSPTDVFVELECEGDLSSAFRKLIVEGYGEE
jgi:Bifunctional DNA primase/polymerase, N-terminal